ncbi:hypothetical protein HA49_05035 [Tatumella morbirosei]|uniref:Uncharacterized protein n=1 Tax=Tatumella morbirosei TaxID=642227 RepID=A0A095VJ91_9GAMM|nr:hypothetical protein HA49_05035 [Tatumella morbirosei]
MIFPATLSTTVPSTVCSIRPSVPCFLFFVFDNPVSLAETGLFGRLESIVRMARRALLTRVKTRLWVLQGISATD